MWILSTLSAQFIDRRIIAPGNLSQLPATIRKFSGLFALAGLTIMNDLGAPPPWTHVSMDLGKRIAQWKEQPPRAWLQMANRRLPPFVSFVLVLAIAERLAALTWVLVPGAALDAPISAPLPTRPPASRASADSDYSATVSAHLFGEAPAAPAEAPSAVVVDAPDTTLSLKLTGVQAYPDSSLGQAIIANGRNQEKAYSVGDTIDDGSGTELHAVFSDRVILSRGGRFETLRLPKEPAAQAAAAPNSRVALPTPDNSGSLRDIISENASRLTDLIRVVPQVEGGQMIGFRINPARDRERFAALGFQPGDVVTDINGTALNDPSQGLQVFQNLGESTQATVTVIRDGTPQVLTIDTSQLEGLAEGRQ
jgi:general secretion pathway protein C